MLSHLHMDNILDHFNIRAGIGKTLRKYLKDRSIKKFVHLALGITDINGNYSAHDHGLAPKILSESSENTVFDLGEALHICSKATHIPNTIYSRNVPYLKIGVGSEIACLIRPTKFWVGNVRTIWAHLLLKHEWKYKVANDELELYRDGEREAEMSYKIWRDIYLSLEPSMRKIALLGSREANKQSVTPGKQVFLWADAVANALYEQKDS